MFFCYVPNLRFSDEQWKSTTLGASCDGFDYGIGAEAIDFDGSNQYIRITDIDDEYSLYTSRHPVSPSFIDENCICKENDILFARTGASTGKTYLYNQSDGKLYFAGFLIRVNVKQSYDSYFIFTITKTNKYNNWVKIMSARSGQPGINAQEYKKLSFKHPSIETQRKISSFIKKIDTRILLQSKIIEDLIIKKKIISDKLFSQIPTHRNNLSFYYVKGKAGGTPKSTNKKFYDGEIPFLSISDMTEQGKYIYRTEKTLTQEGLNNSTAWIVPKDSLLLSMYASVGQVAINRIPLTTSQAIFSMTITDKTILDYLYYYLSYFKENKLHRYLETGTQSNINADFVKGIEIPDYGYCKNKLIVSLLFLMDEKIKKEKDILSLYKKQKAYLLQNMFI